MLPLLSLRKEEENYSAKFISVKQCSVKGISVMIVNHIVIFISSPVKYMEQVVDNLLDVVHPHQAVDPRCLRF